MNLQGDHLGIGQRIGGTDSLKTNLVKLTFAAGLRALTAEHGAHVKNPRIGGFFAAGGNVADGPGGSFGAQGQFASAAVFQRVHLFGHHVGGVAERMSEEFELLQDGRSDF